MVDTGCRSPFTLFNSSPDVADLHAEATAPNAREDPTRNMWLSILQNWAAINSAKARLFATCENHTTNEKSINKHGKEVRNQRRIDIVVKGKQKITGVWIPIVLAECKRSVSQGNIRVYAGAIEQLKARCREVAQDPRMPANHTIIGLAIVGADVRMFFTRGNQCWDPAYRKVTSDRPQTFINIKHTDSQLIWRELESAVAKCALGLMPQYKAQPINLDDLIETQHMARQIGVSADNPASRPPSQQQRVGAGAILPTRRKNQEAIQLQSDQPVVMPRIRQQENSAVATSSRPVGLQQQCGVVRAANQLAQERCVTTEWSRYPAPQRHVTPYSASDSVQQPQIALASACPPADLSHDTFQQSGEKSFEIGTDRHIMPPQAATQTMHQEIFRICSSTGLSMRDAYRRLERTWKLPFGP